MGDSRERYSPHQETVFKELKHQLATVSVLAYFNRDADTQVVADGSPVGLLVQELNGVHRAVCCASTSLIQLESTYSQTNKKKALAPVWAREHFNL